MGKYTDANLKNWNERTPIHARSKFYDVAGFKAGRSTLHSLELEEVANVKARSLLHLQCHFGLDTLSWAKAGAEVTGVDFSDEAIGFAKSLSKEVGIDAQFICSDIFDLPKVLTGRFDIVFASYGVLCWISDIDRWFQIAADYLKDDGFLYLIDDHPFATIFESDLRISYSYFHSDKPVKVEPEGTYTDRSAAVSTPTYQWSHSLGDILNAVTKAGLQLEFLHEFPFSQWARFPALMKDEQGRYVMKDDKIQIPLLFSLRASKVSGS